MENKNYTELLKEIAQENIFTDDLNAPMSEVNDYNRQEELEKMYNRF